MLIFGKSKFNAMQDLIQIKTNKTNGLFDITNEVEQIARRSKVQQGSLSVYVQGATAAIMIQENWDQSVQNDVINLLKKLIPSGVWEHDAQDNNGDAHLKAGLVGPSETIPIVNGSLGLSTWQNIFVCEFDGPRRNRNVIVTIHEA
jgi:secondary thiamine-phosphate synthase enzyme